MNLLGMVQIKASNDVIEIPKNKVYTPMRYCSRGPLRLLKHGSNFFVKSGHGYYQLKNYYVDSDLRKLDMDELREFLNEGGRLCLGMIGKTHYAVNIIGFPDKRSS